MQEVNSIVNNKRELNISSLDLDVNLDNLNKKVFVERKDISQANIIIANDIKIPNNKLDNLFAFELLQSIYSDMTGRLFRIIREKYGLVYRIGFYFSIHSCGGLKWEVDLGLGKDKINKAYDLIIKELSRPFTKKEIEYGLLKGIGAMAISLEDNMNLTKTIANSLIKGIDYREIIYNYNHHLHRVAKSINEFQKMVNFKKKIY